MTWFENPFYVAVAGVLVWTLGVTTFGLMIMDVPSDCGPNDSYNFVSGQCFNQEDIQSKSVRVLNHYNSSVSVGKLGAITGVETDKIISASKKSSKYYCWNEQGVFTPEYYCESNNSIFDNMTPYKPEREYVPLEPN